MRRSDLCGWVHDAAGAAAIIGDPQNDVTDDQGAIEFILGTPSFDSDKPPVILFDALRALHGTWKRGKQGIGDCVSWGYELAATLVHAVDIFVRKEPWVWGGEFATEPIYGGSRVEARGVSRGGWSDGSYGAAAAKFVTKWGALRRINYALTTGNPEHDLTRYSAERAKQWGNYGCGGESDGGKLDLVARETPVSSADLTRTFEEAAVCIENGFPVPVCSDQGFGPRGAEGFAKPSGTWMHCMCFAGVRYDRPGLLLTNSWGNSWGTSKPFYPLNYWPEVQKCSAWIEPEVATRMLSKWEDSFALTGVDGLKRRKIDWESGWEIVGR